MGAKPDFSGYATKAGLKCSDGRTITPEAFKHMGGMTVPLVWQHGHSSPDNVLGHAVLEARDDGVYAYGYFNSTKQGQNAKALVEHKDIRAMSIWANGLVEKVVRGAKSVLHGVIREVSLVLSGANPGAVIDFVQIQHSDDPGDFTVSDSEAIIHTGLEIVLQHDDKSDSSEKDDKTDDELEHATVQEVYDSLNPEQKDVVHYMVAAAMQAAKDKAVAQSGTDQDDKTGDKTSSEGDLDKKEGKGEMTHNVFEKNDDKGGDKHTLSHADKMGIFADAAKFGSMKEAVEAYALKHGIENIDVLFPDAKTITDRPEFNKRRTEWVSGVINGTRHSPFSRIKSLTADLTYDEARAKGYIKGNLKKEEFFSVSKRVTTPQTVYKKQKLDRDDIVDITDFDVVAWLKMEMRIMLEEEIARAILIGDGRDVSDEDKIKDPAGSAEGAGIRSIMNEHELYATTVNVSVGATPDYNNVVESVLRARRFYKGTGTPTLYTTSQVLVEMLLAKDAFNRRRWNTKQELAAALMVADVVEVEVMEDETDLLGIIVNLADYNIGADRGGEINLFDDFDIDYNQYKYLMETRVSGALIKIKSALILTKVADDSELLVPTAPTFNSTTGVVTIPTQTGVEYQNADTDAVLVAGAQAALDPGDTLRVRAVSETGYHFATNASDEWTFTRPAA
jgi:hypothetical protein